MRVKSTRGVQQEDVSLAADALLAEQLKPTIERIRMKLGRGSPNTVGPMLDIWFSTLGPRLGVSGSEADGTPAMPASVQLAMNALWKSALGEAHESFEESKRALLDSVTQREDELARQAGEIEAERAAFQQRDALLRDTLKNLESQLASVTGQVRELQASVNKKDDELKSSREALQSQMAQSNQERLRRDEQFRLQGEEIKAVQSAFALTERRLLTEIDRERQLTKKGQAELDQAKLKLKAQKTEAEDTEQGLTDRLQQAAVENAALTERLSGYVARINDLNLIKKQATSVVKRRKPVSKKTKTTAGSSA